MSTLAYVSALPDCSFCEQKAHYDFRTSDGRWGYGCRPHYLENRGYPTLGTGMGQELRVGEEPERSDATIRMEITKALAAGDLDAAEEALGDRDIAEFL